MILFDFPRTAPYNLQNQKKKKKRTTPTLHWTCACTPAGTSVQICTATYPGRTVRKPVKITQTQISMIITEQRARARSPYQPRWWAQTLADSRRWRSRPRTVWTVSHLAAPPHTPQCPTWPLRSVWCTVGGYRMKWIRLICFVRLWGLFTSSNDVRKPFIRQEITGKAFSRGSLSRMQPCRMLRVHSRWPCWQ